MATIENKTFVKPNAEALDEAVNTFLEANKGASIHIGKVMPVFDSDGYTQELVLNIIVIQRGKK